MGGNSFCTFGHKSTKIRSQESRAKIVYSFVGGMRAPSSTRLAIPLTTHSQFFTPLSGVNALCFNAHRKELFDLSLVESPKICPDMDLHKILTAF